MAHPISITDKPMRVTTTTAAIWQELRLARDVSAFDELDLLLNLYEDTNGSGVLLSIYTGQQIESDDGWEQAGFVSLGGSGVPDSATLNLKNLLRYVRYKVETTGTTATFLIQGLGRRWS